MRVQVDIFHHPWSVVGMVEREQLPNQWISDSACVDSKRVCMVGRTKGRTNVCIAGLLVTTVPTGHSASSAGLG